MRLTNYRGIPFWIMTTIPVTMSKSSRIRTGETHKVKEEEENQYKLESILFWEKKS
jgi:hypothetical protein